MKEKDFEIKEAISFGWEQMKKNFMFFVVFLILTVLIQSIFSSMHGFNLGRSIISFIVSTLISLATTKIALDAANKKTVDFNGIRESLQYYFNFLVVTILVSVIAMAGFILLVVPGFIWATQYSMAPFLVIDKKMSPMEALRESSKITAGKKMQLFVFYFVLLLVVIAGALALGIGLFATVPTAFVASAFVYNKLK